jgi:hypothetical protein
LICRPGSVFAGAMKTARRGSRLPVKLAWTIARKIAYNAVPPGTGTGRGDRLQQGRPRTAASRNG